MQLVSEGQQNIILNGNPSKTFFKTTYSKYTNFGLQKFRVDFEGTPTMKLTESSFFTFKIPRYADLLMDCYLSFDLPNIWSPIIPPDSNNGELWSPYEFKWIEYIGAQMISKIEITCGNQTLQEFSGSYLLSLVQREFNTDKKALFEKMVGHVKENYDPANSGTRVNAYPNAYYTSNVLGAEPSIRGSTLYVPLNTWFNIKSQMAFPLVALQYNELRINITLRPIYELFRIRDVYDTINNYPYIAPNFNLYYMQFYRFLQTPPDINLGVTSYSDLRTIWNADIHLNCTYCFLSNQESNLFALNEQKYLIKQPKEQLFYNVTGSNKIDMNSLGMVSSYTFYLQRSDVNLRNEWSNYTNWTYDYLPQDITSAPTSNTTGIDTDITLGPGLEVDGTASNLYITGVYTIANKKEILISMGLLLDGEYRENTQPEGVFNYVEKYTRTNGNGPDGLYFYSFSLNNSPYEIQPYGGMNMSRFTNIQMELVTITPPLDSNAQSLSICDPQTGNIVGINKPTWNIYLYNYNLYLFEERYNMVIFTAGNAGLLYAL